VLITVRMPLSLAYRSAVVYFPAQAIP